MNVFDIENQVRAEATGQSAQQLSRALEKMGVDTTDMSREEMIQKLVDLEVYAFTH